MSINQEVRIVTRYCPHCGNTVGHELLLRDELEKIDENFRVIRNSVSVGCYLVYKCTTCRKISLVFSQLAKKAEAEEAGEFSMLISALNTEYKQEILYPAISEFTEIIPETIRKTYSEAISIKGKSPNGFAGLIRKALEYLLKEQDAKGKILYDRIKDLSDRNILPPTIIGMGDLIREIGNIGVHAGSEDVSIAQAEVIDKFFNSIIEYVYIAPAKVLELKEELKKAKG